MKTFAILNLSLLAAVVSAQVGFINTDPNGWAPGDSFFTSISGQPTAPIASPIAVDAAPASSVINDSSTSLPLILGSSISGSVVDDPTLTSNIVASITSAASGFVTSAASVIFSAGSVASSIESGAASTIESIKSEASSKSSSAKSAASSASSSLSAIVASKASSLGAAAATDNAAVEMKVKGWGVVAGAVVAGAVLL